MTHHTVYTHLTVHDCENTTVRIEDTAGAFPHTVLQLGTTGGHIDTSAMPATELADYLEAWAEKIRAANTDRYSGKKVA